MKYDVGEQIGQLLSVLKNNSTDKRIAFVEIMRRAFEKALTPIITRANEADALEEELDVWEWYLKNEIHISFTGPDNLLVVYGNRIILKTAECETKKASLTKLKQKVEAAS